MWSPQPMVSPLKLLTPSTTPPRGKDVYAFVQALYVEKLYEADAVPVRGELSKIIKHYKLTLNPPLEDLYTLYVHWTKEICNVTDKLSQLEFERELKQIGVKVKQRTKGREVQLEEWITIRKVNKYTRHEL